jgi:hypothetical protein
MAQILILTAEEGEKERLPLGNRTPKLLSQAIFFHILTLIGRQLGYLFFLLSVLLAGEGFDTALKKYAQHPHTFFSWLWSFVLLRTLE